MSLPDEPFEFTLSEVVGYYLLQPLTTLLEGLRYADPTIPHFHTPVTLVSGYAAAAVPLTLTVVESFSYSAQYLLDSALSPKSPVSFVRSKYPQSRFAQELPELFAVRHAISHGHMWRRDLSVTPGQGVEYGKFEMHDGFGHKSSFFPFIDLATQRTKSLGINIIPTRLGVVDAAIVTRVAMEFLTFLDEEVSTELGRDTQSVINIANQLVVFGGRLMRFPEVVAAIQLHSAAV